MTLVIFKLLKIWSIFGVLWWTLHHWHDLWIFSWLHIINWHSIIYQELVSSYTLFQFRGTLSNPCERRELFRTFCILVRIFYTCPLHIIYSGKECHSFRQAPLLGCLPVPLSFMGIKLRLFFKACFSQISSSSKPPLQSCMRHFEC